MNGENPLPLWVRHALVAVGLFVAGAMLAFGYSYRPLHGALSWQVDQLESRLDERNRENLQLSDALAKQKSNEATRIDPDTLAQVERELEQTRRVLNQAEKDLKRALRKRKQSEASATKWRHRFETLRDAPAPVAAAGPPPFEGPESANPIPQTAPSSPAAPTTAPASPSSSEGSQAALERGIVLPNKEAAAGAP